MWCVWDFFELGKVDGVKNFTRNVYVFSWSESEVHKVSGSCTVIV